MGSFISFRLYSPCLGDIGSPSPELSSILLHPRRGQIQIPTFLCLHILTDLPYFELPAQGFVFYCIKDSPNMIIVVEHNIVLVDTIQPSPLSHCRGIFYLEQFVPGDNVSPPYHYEDVVFYVAY